MMAVCHESAQIVTLMSSLFVHMILQSAAAAAAAAAAKVCASMQRRLALRAPRAPDGCH